MSAVNLPQSLYEDETFDDDGIALRLQLQLREATIENAKEHEREQRRLEAEKKWNVHEWRIGGGQN